MKSIFTLCWVVSCLIHLPAAGAAWLRHGIDDTRQAQGPSASVQLDPPAAIDGIDIEMQLVLYQFGFVTMDLEGSHKWRIAFRDVEGRELEVCHLKDKRVRCED